jgi:hypothetical protein
MKLLVHLVRADVRRFSLLLALWVLIEILSTIFTGVRPVLADDRRMLTAAEILGTVLFMTRWLGMFVIVPLVVQTHPLVGSDAFWMTRPIPPPALLASKVLLIGTTFIAVPALCAVVLTAVCRLPMAEVVLVGLQTILVQTLWLAIVMALSALTRNLARFALVAGGVLVSLVLLFSIMIAVAMRNIPDGPQLSDVTGRPASSATAGVVLLLLLITAVVVPLVVQYRTRSTRVSVGTGVAGVAVVIVVALMWPSHPRSVPVPEWANRESAVHLVAESPKGEFTSLGDWSPWSRSEGWQFGRARLRLRGVEEGWLAAVRLADGTVKFDDGVTLATAGNGYPSTIPFESADEPPIEIVMRQMLGVGRLRIGQTSRLPEAVPAIVVSQADFKKYSGATGTYRGRFLVDLDRLEIAATLPLRAGAEYHDRRRRITIDQVIPLTEAASIRVRQFIASTMFHSDSLPPLSFYLRNRAAGEAVAGPAHQGMFAVSSGGGLPVLYGVSSFAAGPGSNGFSATGDYIRFPDYDPAEDAVAITPDWLSQAELVIVRTVPAGSVTRTVEIPGFEIRAAPPPIRR